MNPYKLRTLAGLIRATESQVEQILQQPTQDQQMPCITYSGAYTQLRKYDGDIEQMIRNLQRWRDDCSIQPRTTTFRQNAYPHLQWCATQVLPKIRQIILQLDGDRQSSGRLLRLAGIHFTGGFHLLVEWEDGTKRLVYFLGPHWTGKKIQRMLTLLQMKAESVYDMAPESVVFVDIKHERLIERRPLLAQDATDALLTAEWLVEYMHGRDAA